MRGKRALKRHRQPSALAPILLAGFVGYLLGSAQITVLRSTDLSAAEAVALRFPQEWNRAVAVNAMPDGAAAMRAAALPDASAARTANRSDADGLIRDAQLALLSPEPIDPVSRTSQSVAGPVSPSADAAATPQNFGQVAAAEPTDTLRAAPSFSSHFSSQPKPAWQPSVPAPAIATLKPAAAHRRGNDRSGYMFNDAQIASIKQRLNLTPDQERMWPAVEAALRNMTYTHAPAAHPRGATGTQVAAVDPNAVEGLKSAAVPLIMSFNDEQKEQVRNLAHVMGLDQLATQF
jgi:hypothetical protein